MEVLDKYVDRIVVYMDGSKTETGTGAKIFSEDFELEISIPLGSSAHSFRLKLLPFERDAKRCWKENPPARRF